MAARKFDIWANRGVQFVAADSDLSSYDNWLCDYAESWLRSILKLFQNAAGAFVKDLQDALIRGLMHRVQHWKAEARDRLTTPHLAEEKATGTGLQTSSEEAGRRTFVMKAEPASENPRTSTATARRRGPARNYERAAKIDAIVSMVAPEGRWRDHLDEIYDALDEEGIPWPKTWLKKDPRCKLWSDVPERGLAVKAISYCRKKAAEHRRKSARETFS